MPITLLGSADAKITYGDVSQLGGITTGLTVAIDVVIVNGTATERRLCGQWGATLADDNFLLAVQDADELGWVVNGPSQLWGIKSDGLDLIPGAYKICCTYDCSTKQGKIFVNGAQQSTSSWLGGSPAVLTNATTPVYIGNDGLGNDGVDGTYSQFAVWGQVLSDAVCIAITNGTTDRSTLQASTGILYAPLTSTTAAHDAWSGYTGTVTAGLDVPLVRTLDPAHALTSAVVSCAVYADHPGYPQRIDIAPGGTTVALTTWTGHALGVQGPVVAGTETYAAIDTSAQASNYHKYSIGLVFSASVWPAYGTAGTSVLVLMPPHSLAAFEAAGNRLVAFVGGNQAVHYVTPPVTNLVAVMTFDAMAYTFGTIRLYVNGALVVSTSTVYVETGKPTQVGSRWDSTTGNVVKHLELVWNKQLSDTEVADWSADPYGILSGDDVAPTGGSALQRRSMMSVGLPYLRGGIVPGAGA